MKRGLLIGLVAVLSLSLAGCGMFKKTKKEEGANTQEQIKLLEQELARKDDMIEELMNKQDRDLEAARRQLERDLQKELNEYKAKLEMTDRGLVITFLAEIFYNPGKADIKEQGFETLQKVAAVLNEKVSESNIAIEGYTDNDPIKYSGWKSNWELSTARALGVLHYFVDECSVDPNRVCVVGYGEFKPVASNETKEGKQQNRRVEIVILPKNILKTKTQ